MWSAAKKVVSYKEDSTSESVLEEEDFGDGLDFADENPENKDSEEESESIEDQIDQVGQALEDNLQANQSLSEPRDHFSPIRVTFPVNAPALRPPVMAVFEDENGTDNDGALGSALRSLERLEWDDNDVQWFFNRCETRMGAAGVKKNYTKFQVLSEILPKKVQDQVKPLLRKSEADFTNKDGYKQLKNKVLQIFGQRPEASMDRALARVLTGKPSELARALVDDMCKKELDCQCCPANVLAMWRRHLPTNVQAGIAHTTFDKDSFDATVQLADKIFATQMPRQVAAISATGGASALDETQHAIPYAEVAAIRGGNRGRGRGRGRGNRGRGGQGQPQTQARRGAKHPDLPPGDFKWCNMHFKFGKGAYFCADPSSCPWKDITTPKPAK